MNETEFPVATVTSPCNRVIASATNKKVILWRMSDKKPFKTIQYNANGSCIFKTNIICIAFAIQDGNLILAIASEDCHLQTEYQREYRYPVMNRSDGPIKIWSFIMDGGGNYVDIEFITCLECPTYPNKMEFSKGGNILVTFHYGMCIRVYRKYDTSYIMTASIQFNMPTVAERNITSATGKSKELYILNESNIPVHTKIYPTCMKIIDSSVEDNILVCMGFHDGSIRFYRIRTANAQFKYVPHLEDMGDFTCVFQVKYNDGSGDGHGHLYMLTPEPFTPKQPDELRAESNLVYKYVIADDGSPVKYNVYVPIWRNMFYGSTSRIQRNNSIEVIQYDDVKRILVTASYDADVRVWRLKSENMIKDRHPRIDGKTGIDIWDYHGRTKEDDNFMFLAKIGCDEERVKAKGYLSMNEHTPLKIFITDSSVKNCITIIFVTIGNVMHHITFDILKKKIIESKSVEHTHKVLSNCLDMNRRHVIYDYTSAQLLFV